MQNRHLIDLAVAAKRWREAQKRRLDAGRAKRVAQEAERASFAFYNPQISRARSHADAAVSSAKREERKALKALAKLCDQAAPVEDVLIIEEVCTLQSVDAGKAA